MYKIIVLLTMLPFLGYSQVETLKSKTSEKGFTITATVSQLPKGAAVKLVNANTGAELASAIVLEKKSTVIKSGKRVPVLNRYFILKGKIEEPDLCMLSVGDLRPLNMYVENAVISISGSGTDASKWKVKGSASHADFQHFEKTFTPLAQQLNNTASTINTLTPGPARDSLMTIYTSTQLAIQSQIDNFVTTRPSSYVAPFVLLVMMNFNNDPVMAEERFGKLAKNVQQSYIGKILSSQIAESKIGAVGTAALEFSQPDTSGNPVALSSFRGKYVLVDFWASWCGPCRQENPNVVYSYQKFRDKNFTVLGVSLDRPGQKDKWLQAIKEDGLTWTHVSDLKHWDNEAARLYHIQGIPQNILIDPNGKIVGKNLRGPALEAKLCEILGCN